MIAPLLFLVAVNGPIVITGRGLRPGETKGASVVAIEDDRIRQSADGSWDLPADVTHFACLDAESFLEPHALARIALLTAPQVMIRTALLR